jgi:hypothetical protein
MTEERRDVLASCAIVAVLSFFFLALELRYPYYFFQDDNRHVFLPNFFHNVRALIAGELPLFNFHQFLGVPQLANGQSAVLMPTTYPAVILSLAIAKHPYASIDIMVVAHLFLAALGAYYLMKKMGFGRAAGYYAAFTWPLTSFVIYLSASWWWLSVVAACLPWQLHYVLRLFEKQDGKTLLLLAALRLYVMLTGHGQYFIYSLIFETMAFLMVYVHKAIRDGQWKVRIPACFAGSIVITLVFSLPLTLPMFHEIQNSAARCGAYTWQEFTTNSYSNRFFIDGAFSPFSHTGNQLSFFSHTGYLTLLLLVPLLAGLVKKKVAALYPLLLFVVGLTAHLCASNTLIMKLLYHVPFINRLRWPFKFELYALFAIVCLGAIGCHALEQMQRGEHKRMNVLIAAILTLQCANLWSLYLLREPGILRMTRDPIPFREPLVERLKGGRIITVGFEGNESLTVPTLGYDYCLLWGLQHFSGYDILIPRENSIMTLNLNYDASIDYPDGKLPIPYLRFCGVAYYVVSKAKDDLYRPLFQEWHLSPCFSDETRTVYQDSKMRPLVYWGKNPRLQQIALSMHVNSLEARVNAPEEGMLVFNVAFNPFFKAYVDGKETAVVPWGLDFPFSLGDRQYTITAHQMGVPVTSGSHLVKIAYSDPYFLWGLYIASAAALAMILFFLLTGRRGTPPLERKERGAENEDLQHGLPAGLL